MPPRKNEIRQRETGTPQGTWPPAAESTFQKPHMRQKSIQQCDTARPAAPASRTPRSMTQDSEYCRAERLWMDKTRKGRDINETWDKESLINLTLCWHYKSWTFGALQAIARHAKLGGESAEGGDGALDRMNEKQGPLCTLDLIQWANRGAIWVHQQPTQIWFQQTLSTRTLCRRSSGFWEKGEEELERCQFTLLFFYIHTQRI